MRKYTKEIGALLAASLLTVTGCTTTDAGKSDKATVKSPEFLQEIDRTAMRNQAITQGTTMLQAVQNKDYNAFTQFFPAEVKQKFTPQAFAQFDTYLGKLEKWEYLTDMVTPLTTTYLWKTTIRRKDPQGKEILINMLFQLSLAKKDGKYVVVGSLFR